MARLVERALHGLRDGAGVGRPGLSAAQVERHAPRELPREVERAVAPPGLTRGTSDGPGDLALVVGLRAPVPLLDPLGSRHGAILLPRPGRTKGPRPGSHRFGTRSPALSGKLGVGWTLTPSRTSRKRSASSSGSARRGTRPTSPGDTSGTASSRGS